MKPEDQRIALAKACGWRFEKSSHLGRDVEFGYPPNDTSGYSMDILEWPDYLNDLNAVHEAERYLADNVFGAEEWSAYGKLLEDLHESALLVSKGIPIKDEDLYWDVAEIANTPASVRVEALLKTLKLWTYD